MTPKLTPEMREALEQHPGQPLEVQDDQTHKVYLLFDREQARDLLDRWIIQELEVAEADMAIGRTVPWNPGDILRQAQMRNKRRSVE